jgi:GxxExxY protein
MADTTEMQRDFFSRGANHRDTEITEARHDRREIPDRLNRLCGRAIGAAIEVHRHLGPGFLESTYEEALALEFRLRSIKFERQAALPVLYKGQTVADQRVDLLVEGELVLELKAVERLLPIHAAQLLAYLKAGSFQVGLLINFNVHLLKEGIKRYLWDL